MAHSTQNPPATLELRLVEAATPERVEVAARLFRRMLHAVHPGLPPESFTMVVTNLNMGAALRPWTEEAQDAARSMADFARAPIRYLKQHPGQLELASIVTEFVRDVQAPGGVRLSSEGAKHRPVRIDQAFAMKVARHIAKVPATAGSAELLMLTSTSVRSAVLRVGRASEGRPNCARILFDGEARDVPITGAVGPFYDAAKEGGLYRIRLRAAWRRGPDGKRRLDHEASGLVSLAKLAPPLHGEALLKALADAMPSLQSMSDEEVEARLDQVRGG